MVNNWINVSAHEGEPPLSGESRKITGGPLYEPARVLIILSSGEESARAWTRKCKDDLQKYTLDAADTVELLTEALQYGRYRDSEMV